MAADAVCYSDACAANGLIDQVQLSAAFQAWTEARARPLADHLTAVATSTQSSVQESRPWSCCK